MRARKLSPSEGKRASHHLFPLNEVHDEHEIGETMYKAFCFRIYPHRQQSELTK